MDFELPEKNSVLYFTRRNLLSYFRDRGTVFYSLLGALVILGLYIAFLRSAFVSDLNAPGAANVIDLWMVAGIMAVVPVTTALGALGIIVNDREAGGFKDFAVSPVSPITLTCGYVLAAMAVSTLMSLITLALCQIYIISLGGSVLSGVQFAKVLGILALSVLSSSSILFFIISFIKSEGGFTGLSLTMGVLSGFFVGMYVPLGNLPKTVADVFSALPMSQSASLFRNVMGGERANGLFEGAPPEALTDFRYDMGFDLYAGSWVYEPWISVAILAVSAAVFFILAVLNVSRRQT